MSFDSPAAILFSRDGYDVVILDGYGIISQQTGIISVARDGNFARFITADSSGNQIVVGAGTAGSPVGGVVSIQGTPGGTPIPVSGTFSANVDGYVTSSVPTYPNNTFQSFSLTTDGLLRTEDILEAFSQYRAQNITTTASEALGGVTILTNRKVVFITPTDGYVYWGLDNLVTPLTGVPIFKNQMFTISASFNVHIWLIASMGTVNCRIVEAG